MTGTIQVEFFFLSRTSGYIFSYYVYDNIKKNNFQSSIYEMK